MATYQQIINTHTGQPVPNFIQRVSDSAVIPFDPENVDYQAYVKWVAQNNESEG